MNSPLYAPLSECLSSQSYELPPLPESTLRVLELLRREEINFQELEGAVSRDPMMAAQVLRVANSAAFYGRREISSLKEAITRIGARLLGRIALSSQVARIFEVPGYEALCQGYWRHAQLSGSYAAEIALRLRGDPELSYLCGLLHTIGQPVVLRAAARLSEELGIPVTREELEGWLTQWSRPVGESLAASWGMPGSIQAAITWNSEPLKSPSHRKEVMITSLASLMASCHQRPPEAVEESVKHHPALQALGIEPTRLVAILGTSRLIQEAESMAAPGQECPIPVPDRGAEARGSISQKQRRLSF